MTTTEIYFGVFSTVSKSFVFGIKEKTKALAWEALKRRIGKDALKYRFCVRRITN